MSARKLDHAVRKRRAPKVSIKFAPHLRSTLQLLAKVFAPPRFIIQRRAREIFSGKKFRGAQRIINAFAGDRIREARGVAEQGPTFAARAPSVPRARPESRNA